jgi:hypothetical protein
MSTGRSIAPVTKTLELECSAEHAFSVFTRHLATWWPLESHSCFLDRSARIEFDEHVGGHVWEVRADGERAPWGEVLEWRPPLEFAMTWHPGNEPRIATRLRVEFAPLTPSRCRLHLVHDAWDARGADANDVRDAYDSGWDLVLARYPARAVTRKTG